MPVRSREEALAAFDGRMAACASALQEAIDEFYKECGSVAYALEGWTRAGIIRDLAKEKFSLLTVDDDGMRIHRKGNATSFSVGQFNFRIKKLDHKFRARTSRTRASRRFDRNQTSLMLDDQPATNVYFGYAPTENDPQHPPLFLVCNDESGKPAWEPISVTVAGVGTVDITPASKPEQPLVKVKQDRKRRGDGTAV